MAFLAFHPGALFCHNNAVSATLYMMSRSPGAPVTKLDASLAVFHVCCTNLCTFYALLGAFLKFSLSTAQDCSFWLHSFAAVTKFGDFFSQGEMSNNSLGLGRHKWFRCSDICSFFCVIYKCKYTVKQRCPTSQTRKENMQKVKPMLKLWIQTCQDGYMWHVKVKVRVQQKVILV